MEFTPVAQNGITPQTDLNTIQSHFRLLASSTSTTYGKPFVLKALSDAAVYKENPVTFYSLWDNGTTTTTITLGTGSFVNVSSAPLVLNNINTGTHQIWAEWPGQGKFAGQTTQATLIPVTIAAGENLGGTFSIIVNKPSGTVVAGEGSVTFEALLTTSTYAAGNISFFEDHVQIGSVPIFENAAFLTVPSLDAGVHEIVAYWAGGNIDGRNYQGESATITYEVLAGTDSHANMSLAFDPVQGVYQEGVINITATINTTTSVGGNIEFFNSTTSLGIVPVVGNSATLSKLNNLSTGTYTFSANWDGNQTSHPRYLTLTTSSDYTIYERATPDTLTLIVTPTPTAFKVNTTFVASFNTSTPYTGTINFYSDTDLLGQADLIDNVATFSTPSLIPGDYGVYAYYPGSATAPKYYSTSSEIISLHVATGINFPTPITLNITNENYAGLNQFVKGYPVYFNLSVTTSTNLSPDITYIVENYQPLTTSTWSYDGTKDTSVPTYSYDSSGTHSVYGLWQGGTFDGKFYAAQRTTPSIFTVTDAYVIGQPLTIDVSNDNYRGTHNPYVKGETQTILSQLSGVSTSMTGEMDFYVNNSLVGTATIVSNLASFPTIFNSSGTYTVSTVWTGGNDINGRPFSGEVSPAFTVTVVDAYTLDRPITVQVKSSDVLAPLYYQGDTQTITASVSTSSQLTGPVDFFNLTTSSRIISSTSTLYGLGLTPDNEWLELVGQMSDSSIVTITTPTNNTFTATVFGTLNNDSIGSQYGSDKFEVMIYNNIPLNSTVLFSGTSTIYTVDGSYFLNAVTTTSTVIDTNITFIGTGTFNTNQTASITKNLTLGTNNIYARWKNGTADGGHPYYSTTSSVTTASVRAPYSLYSDPVLSVQLPVIVNEPAPFTFTASAASSLTNLVNYYDGVTSIGTGTLNPLTNSTITNLTFSSTGGHFVSGHWIGGFVQDHTYYNSATSNTLYVDVALARTLTQSFTLVSNTYTNSIGVPTILSATLNTSTVFNGSDRGTITFKQGNNTLGTSTFVNNTATLTLAPGTLNTGTYPITAIWSGASVAPKYFGKISNTITETILPLGNVSVVVNTVTNFTYYNIDRSHNYAQININVNGIYPTHTPSGSINLYDGLTKIGSGIISDGVASITWDPSSFNELDVGTRSLTANFAGDGWNNQAVTTATFSGVTKATQSPSLSFTVTNQYWIGPTYIKLNTNGARPTGLITLKDGTTILATTNAPNAGGIVDFGAFTFTSAIHTLSAVIEADMYMNTGTTATVINLTQSLVPTRTGRIFSGTTVFHGSPSSNHGTMTAYIPTLIGLPSEYQAGLVIDMVDFQNGGIQFTHHTLISNTVFVDGYISWDVYYTVPLEYFTGNSILDVGPFLRVTGNSWVASAFDYRLDQFPATIYKT